MFNNKKILAIIPARSESKRLPKKNILDFCGRPLIWWSIKAGLGSSHIDTLIVSTDSKEIARTSLDYGAEVPFIRPRKLALDNSSSFDVVEHAVKYCREKLGKDFDAVILLQPTSPLRTKKNIDEALELFFRKNANAVVSVCETECPLSWCGALPNDLSMKEFINKDKGKKKKNQKKQYRINGAIYICRTKVLLEEKSFVPQKKSFAYVMKREGSVDIDTKLDFVLAEAIKKTGTFAF